MYMSARKSLGEDWYDTRLQDMGDGQASKLVHVAYIYQLHVYLV